MTGRAALGVLGVGIALGLAPGCRGGAADSDDLAEQIEAAASATGLDDRADDRPGFLAALTPKQFADVTAPSSNGMPVRLLHAVAAIGRSAVSSSAVDRIETKSSGTANTRNCFMIAS